MQPLADAGAALPTSASAPIAAMHSESFIPSS
jgi:hypothetical protein